MYVTPGVTTIVPINSHVINYLLRVDTNEKAFVGVDSGLWAGTWKGAAKGVVKNVTAWVEANRSLSLRESRGLSCCF